MRFTQDCEIDSLPCQRRICLRWLTVSGAVYESPRNASRIDGLSLVFSGKSEAQLKLKYLGTDLTIPVGWVRIVR